MTRWWRRRHRRGPIEIRVVNPGAPGYRLVYGMVECRTCGARIGALSPVGMPLLVRESSILDFYMAEVRATIRQAWREHRRGTAQDR